MLTIDYDFYLPKELIAQHPPKERGTSRLMVLDRISGGVRHLLVSDLPSVLPKGSLLVFNNTRVRKARLFGRNENDILTEFLLLENLTEGVRWSALCKNAAKRRAGSVFYFPAGLEGKIEGRHDNGVVLCFDHPVDDAYLEEHGRVPLPPYIKREDKAEDEARYQTIFARENGSAAAPTAGLHFTEKLLSELSAAGIESVFVTLHVGLGTFAPVRTVRVEEHKMHEERYFIDANVAERIQKAKQDGRPVTACGTTSARTLESAWSGGRLCAGSGSTKIFIYGDYRFKVVDSLFTNFHTPLSSLLMLVSCFAGQRPGNAGSGHRLIMDAYAAAIERRYRFFSYGDAMLIL
ncbi:MAG: tRNA preQ1(34) S-adenosylmethionine ribosyltransferase-isomerase QueA [Spirochaetaceae bacterium]|jgi:S-adenosylmethionine:tRNA ribosyltransferase-isomerase|nr:tRNA preQ1(34) S-adenosylmethionine ribosyltransferase-isomerase QueA [Spirochaetaceae bacterium]